MSVSIISHHDNKNEEDTSQPTTLFRRSVWQQQQSNQRNSTMKLKPSTCRQDIIDLLHKNPIEQYIIARKCSRSSRFCLFFVSIPDRSYKIRNAFLFLSESWIDNVHPFVFTLLEGM
jgi:hypothetical protein